MGKRKSPQKGSDREKKWQKIFQALVKLSQNQQNDRQILEDKVKYLHGVIHKMKLDMKINSLKAELLLASKERGCNVYKHRYENEVNDLADLNEWCDHLVQKYSGPTDTSIDVSNKGESSQNKALQDEVKKLKSEIEKNKLEKDTEISVLLAEKNFVWNQYKEMERNFTEQLRKKDVEVENANQKVQALVSREDEIHISNEKLRANITKMESESIQKNEEISKLMKEIESLKSRSGSASTLLRPCRSEAASSTRRGKSLSAIRGSIAKVKESDPSQTTEKTTRTRPYAHKSTGGKAPRKRLVKKGSSSSERKSLDEIPDTPRLFTSSFKVPKLKN